MIRRLPRATEQRLLTILTKAATGPFNERQACLDFAGIVSSVPAVVASYKARPGRGRKADTIRVLAEFAADIYWKHTGKGPGRSEYVYRSKRRDPRRYGQGGNYPAFIATLASAIGIPCNGRSLSNACREVQRALNSRATLPRLRRLTSEDDCYGNLRAGRDDVLMAKRETARAALLVAHVVGQDEAGFDVFGGYEPARDPVDAAEAFNHLTKSQDDQLSEPQPKHQLRSLKTVPRNSR